MQHLYEGFKDYLESAGVSKKTRVNYLSDLSNFLSWAKSPSTTSLAASFTSDFLAEYRNYLTQADVPVGTINRRLSALRHFGRFLVWYKLINENPAENLENLPRSQSHKATSFLITNYIQHLKQNGVTRREIEKTKSTLGEFLSIAGLPAQTS